MSGSGITTSLPENASGDRILSGSKKLAGLSPKTTSNVVSAPSFLSAEGLLVVPKSVDGKGLEQDSAFSSSEHLNDILVDEPSKDMQHHELESRIVKECIREFTKGTMFFSYNFGNV